MTRWYAVVASWWRRRTALTDDRPLLRWRVVRETRLPYLDIAIAGELLHVWSYETVSHHWTKRAAERAADQLRQETPR